MSLTSSQVVDRVYALAAEQGEHVYQKPSSHPDADLGAECYYVHHDENGVHTQTAGCILGKALSDLGVSLDDLAVHENEPGEAVVAAFTGLSQSRREDLHFLQSVQSYQDQGNSWGEAVSKANNGTRIAYGADWRV